MGTPKQDEHRQALTERAREFRKKPTPAENVLWRHIKNRQLGGYKFRRQHRIDRFIVDFVCIETKLVVELDGKVHNSQEEYDHVRTQKLKDFGYSVLRIGNEQVFENLDSVKQTIVAACSRPHPRGLTD